MATPLLELEGTWEEIAAQLPDFNGQRLHVIVHAVNEDIPASGHLDAALARIWETVPNASWEKIPDDYGENIDHYLYGTPKRTNAE